MRVARYFLVGGVAAGVDLVLFVVMVKGLAVGWMPAGMVSFCFATLVNYSLSVRYVFSSGVRFQRGQEILLVFLVSGVGLVVNQAALATLIEGAGWDSLIAKIVATSAVFFWNYGVRRCFIFKPRF
jgi:putative flippase GtrA